MVFLPRRDDRGEAWEVVNVRTGERAAGMLKEIEARKMAHEASAFLQQREELEDYERQHDHSSRRQSLAPTE
jgi:hypothetical protein